MRSNRPSSPTHGPLTGVRVVDLSINVLGPVATQILGDMGADVIKVETSDGDQNRTNGPSRNPGMAVLFLLMNRNKRSIVLDLKRQECLEALMKIIETADVFVHSMRASAASRLGISYEQISRRNPSIIYAYGPGYRSDGPKHDDPAFDDVIQGASGLARLNAGQDGVPKYFPTVIADKFCGYVLASSVSMALYHRERTGEGQMVQVPMFETMLQFNLFEHLWEASLDRKGESMGYPRMFTPHRKPYPTKDGHICVLAVNDLQWTRLLGAIDRSDLLDDPMFSDMSKRLVNIGALYKILAQTLLGRTTAEWTETFLKADVSHGPVNSFEDLLTDPYLLQTGYFREYEHPTEGSITEASIPMHFSASPATYRRHAPNLGEHNHEILRSVGYSDKQIAEIVAKQDIFVSVAPSTNAPPRAQCA